MGDDNRQRPLRVEHHSIRPRAPASVDLIAVQNGKLIPRPRDGDVKSLPVVELVWVVVGSLRLARLVKRVALLHGGVNVCLPITGRAAGVDAALSFHKIRVEFLGEQ